MKRIVWFWLAAIVITIASIIFQRQTGPTYPKKVKFEIDTISTTLKLPRSHEVDKQLNISIPSIPWEWTPNLYYRHYPSSDDSTWYTVAYIPEANEFIFSFPIVSQKAAKKEYYLKFSNLASGEEIIIPEDGPVIIRFKGSVPGWALAPHIVLLFIALIFSNLAGIMAFYKNEAYKFWGVITLALIFIGGLIFGPIVQKYAFDHYWTGFPFGSDLTDNKTLIMFIVWGIAVFANTKRYMPWLSVLAAVVTIVIYCIPHSLRGSQFDYETGEIVTGAIMYFRGFIPI